MIQTYRSAEFPPPEAASAEGLLAVGGDLSERRLLAAYCGGIFPWYAPGEPILWWSPDPRCVLFPAQFKPARSLRKTMRRENFRFAMDTAFARVIEECAAPRPRSQSQNGGASAPSWITPEMARAYTALHRAGIAHSAEIWRRGKLVGGLYGVALGGVFFGESMFSRADDASKAALARLMEMLVRWDFQLVDCQVRSAHLLRLGAVEIPRAEFMRKLRAALRLRGRPGSWAAYGDENVRENAGEEKSAAENAGGNSTEKSAVKNSAENA